MLNNTKYLDIFIFQKPSSPLHMTFFIAPTIEMSGLVSFEVIPILSDLQLKIPIARIKSLTFFIKEIIIKYQINQRHLPQSNRRLSL